jgi:hypothetical protein
MIYFAKSKLSIVGLFVMCGTALPQQVTRLALSIEVTRSDVPGYINGNVLAHQIDIKTLTLESMSPTKPADEVFSLVIFGDPGFKNLAGTCNSTATTLTPRFGQRTVILCGGLEAAEEYYKAKFGGFLREPYDPAGKLHEERLYATTQSLSERLAVLEANSGDPVKKEQLQSLLQRFDNVETRVKALEVPP